MLCANHGCHGYSSSRNSVPWAFSSLVVQRGATSQRDRQQSADRARQPVRGTRPALTKNRLEKTSSLVQGWGAVQMTPGLYSSLDERRGSGQGLHKMPHLAMWYRREDYDRILARIPGAEYAASIWRRKKVLGKRIRNRESLLAD